MELADLGIKRAVVKEGFSRCQCIESLLASG